MATLKLARRRSISSWLIILLCSGAGMLLAFVISWDSLLTASSAPTALPPLPIEASAIYGIDTGYFFQADPYIQATDGQTYGLIWEQGTYSWQLSAAPATVKTGDPCSSEDVRLIETSAGPIIDCQVVSTLGEWCPGPIVSFAINEEDDVWELTETPACLFFLGVLITLFVPAGFVLGVIIVVLRRLLRRHQKGEQPPYYGEL